MSDIPVQQKAGWATAIAATLFIFALATDAVMMPIATTAVTDDLKTDTGMWILRMIVFRLKKIG